MQSLNMIFMKSKLQGFGSVILDKKYRSEALLINFPYRKFIIFSGEYGSCVLDLYIIILFTCVLEMQSLGAGPF